MSIEQGELESFELAYSVQIDSSKMLELLVDETESGDCIWQITTSSGQVLDRSERYDDQARCLRDGLNKALGEGTHMESGNKVKHVCQWCGH